MKVKIINNILITTAILILTACGGSNNKGSNSCLSNFEDSDGDGFRDVIDKAPNDASIPGDFSTPEKILANKELKKILEKAKEDFGITVHTQLKHNPPDLTGYYRKEYGNGKFYSSTRGFETNHTGLEERVCTANEYYESNGLNFLPSSGNGSTYTIKGAMLRGNKNNFTYYLPIATHCGKETTAYGVVINSGNLNADGDRKNIKYIVANLAIVGPNKSQCTKWNIGDYEIRFKKINDLTELEYMCVDEGKAYIPNETWKNKAKESCKCTADIEIECE